MAWLTSHAWITPDEARRLLVLGAACRRLPVTATAVSEGMLSVGQVRQITNHLSDKTIELFAEHETELVPTLVPLALRQVNWVMGRWQRHAETALGLEQGDALPDRSLHLSRVGQRWRLDADLDIEGGALLDTVIRHVMTRDADGEPPRSPARRRADALIDLLRWYLDHHHDNKVARRRTHLDVIIGVDALQHGGPGELPDGTLVDAKTMARLACDAHLHRVIMDRSSTLLDYGRRTHIVPHGLREALNVRDRHCRFSDCDRPPAWCEAHHVLDWELGGPHQARQPRVVMQPPSPHPPPRRLETLSAPRQHPRSHHTKRTPIRKPKLRAHAHDRVTLTRARSTERGIAEREDTAVTRRQASSPCRWASVACQRQVRSTSTTPPIP